jgi:hypothetical protein
MSTRFAAMPRLVICSAIVGAMVFGLFGCAKKEAEQAETTAETMPAEEVAVAPAETPAAVGMYLAEIGTGNDAQKVSVTLNTDNTAMMSVEYMNGTPAMVQNGSWSMGETPNTINFVYGTEGAMMTMPFAVDGDNLQLSGDPARGFGTSNVTLVKQPAGAEDPHAGHDH